MTWVSESVWWLTGANVLTNVLLVGIVVLQNLRIARLQRQTKANLVDINEAHLAQIKWLRHKLEAVQARPNLWRP